MGIKPIDLQTLFAKLGEVSKEQSLVKEQSSLQQAQAARAQVTKELEEDRRVAETVEDRGTEAVEDENGTESKGGRRGNKDQKDGAGDEEGREIVTDPEVGRHVDLSG